MPMISFAREDIERVKASIDLTRDRFEREGFNSDDEGLDMLEEFCDLLLKGKGGQDAVDSFLSGQDLERP